jgi:outer membrane protein assembly factor BamB
MSVAGERVFLQGARGDQSFVIALNRADGTEVWSKALGPIETRMRTPQGAGPRGTPTVDGDRLYALTENGDLACLRIDGTLVWQKNILTEYGGSQLQWMVSESPLVDGPHLVVSPGGSAAGMVQLDKMTGTTVWTSKELSDTAAYSSIVAADVQGVRTYMTFTHSAAVGVRASDGKLMFRYPTAANNVANIATPRNRRRATELDRAERGGLGDRGVLHARDEEPSRWHGARRRLSLRIQRPDIDVPRIRHRQADVARSERR